MKMTLIGAASLAVLAVASIGSASAAPFSPSAPSVYGGDLQLVHNGAHRSCQRGPQGWHYIGRGGNRIECRPSRPSGVYWSWRTEGDRRGWYHSRDRRWN
jgi:hypothetical protein